MLALIGITAGACGSDAPGAAVSPATPWETGAIRRLMDGLYRSNPPTFAGGGPANLRAVVQAGTLTRALGDAPLALRLADVVAAASDHGERLVLADMWTRLGVEPTDDDRRVVAGLRDTAGDLAPYETLVLERITVAVGAPDLTRAAPACPTGASTDEQLFAAGIDAARLALRSTTCPRLAGTVPRVDATGPLTPELIERARATGALAAVGSLPTSDGFEAGRLLQAAAVRELDAGAATGSIIELLYEAHTADPAGMTEALRSRADPVRDGAERTVRWVGSLADTITGVDATATAQALRALRLLSRPDDGAFAFARDEVFVPYLQSVPTPAPGASGPTDRGGPAGPTGSDEVDGDDGGDEPDQGEGDGADDDTSYRVLVQVALGETVDAALLERIKTGESELLPTTVLALGRVGPCLSPETFRRHHTIAGSLPAHFRESIRHYAGRCGVTDLSDLSDPSRGTAGTTVGTAPVGGGAVFADGAVECTRDGAPSPATVTRAGQAAPSASSRWPDAAEVIRARDIPRIETIAETVAITRLAQGRCDGFWWLA